MFDRANNKLFVGDKVIIMSCDDYPSLVGRIATIMDHQDNPNKIKVSFSDQWQGYFRGVDVEKYIEEEHKGNDIDKKNSIIYLMNVIFDSIEEKYKFLEDIDKSNEFNSRDWFFFGTILHWNTVAYKWKLVFIVENK